MFDVVARNPLSSIEDGNYHIDDVGFVIVKKFEIKRYLETFSFLFIFSEGSFAQLIDLAFETSSDLFSFEDKD